MFIINISKKLIIQNLVIHMQYTSMFNRLNTIFHTKFCESAKINSMLTCDVYICWYDSVEGKELTNIVAYHVFTNNN